MNNNNFISLTPGSTFLHKLTGATKVRLFLVLSVCVTMSFDFPIIAPLFVAGLIGLISLKPNWKKVLPLIVIVVLMNLFNIFLYYIADPDCGSSFNGDSTVLYAFTDYFVVTRGTLWYLFVRITKMLASFLISLTFIMSITPSEIAAGLSSIGLSYKIGAIVEIAFRYIPDISRDFEAISISMQCRGLEMDKKRTSPFARLKQYILILIPLIITSFDRVGNIANAMDLRGFGKGKKRSYYAEHEKTWGDHLLQIVALLVLLFVIAYIVWSIVTKRSDTMWIYW